MKPRIAIWAAVSTPQQATIDKDSLPGQVRDGRAWAAEMGGEVARVYQVPGHTRRYIHFRDAARDMDAYRQLAEDCEAGEFDVLWVRERSRLGRTDALIATAEAVVREAGAEVYSAAMPHQIGYASKAGAIFTSSIERATAQTENIQRTQRHHDGIRARVLRGLPGGKWPHGYQPVRDERGRTVGGELLDGEWQAVRLATQLYLKGKGYRSIAGELERSPWRPRHARRWTWMTVRNMMNNDLYAGYVVYADVRSEKSEKFPALWSDEEYREVIRERAVRRERGRGGRAPATFVSGLVFCRRCGRPMAATNYPLTKEKRYYRCSTQTEAASTGIHCHNNAVRFSVIVGALEVKLEEWRHISPSDIMAMLLEMLGGAGPDKLEAQIAAAEANTEKVQKQLERLYVGYASGEVQDHCAFRTVETELMEKKAACLQLVANLRQQLMLLPDPAEVSEHIAEMLALRLPLRELPADEVRAALRRAGVRIWCEDGEVTDVTLTL